MIRLLGCYKLGESGESWLDSMLAFLGFPWDSRWRVKVEKEDLGIIFSQGPLSIFMCLWWQTSVELRVASAWAGDNICWRLGHLAEPSTLSGPGTASVWAQDMCLNLT